VDRREFLLSSIGVALTTQESWGGSTSKSERIVIGDAQLQIVLAHGPHGLEEKEIRVDQVVLPGLAGVPWTANLGGVEAAPKGRVTRSVVGDGVNPARSASFEGVAAGIGWSLKYEVTGGGRITKTLSFAPTRRSILNRVSLWNGRCSQPPGIARTKLQDIAAFYRHRGRGIFVSLDFPYSKIENENGWTQISYPPQDALEPGRTYSCHSLTLGAVGLSGVERYGSDLGEVEAMDTYIQERYPPRFGRPMFVSASITNRYTQVQGDIIFYTMKDQPTLNFNVDLLRRELALMPRLGMEYYQVFPGVFDWGPDDPSPDVVQSLMKYARSQGVRMGGYSATNRLFVDHYNEYRNRLDRPDWEMRNEAGVAAKGVFCFGSSDFVEYYKNTVVANSERYGFELHCFDGLHLAPCYAGNHGHLVGQDSLYHQVRGLVRLLEAIDGVSPQMMTWSNSGNWQDLLPKLAWSNHNLYLTDPFIETPWQGLNMTRLLDDARREQMVSLHYTHFVPYRFYSNCQYFFCQNSVVPDSRNFEYGALSSIAVTPNLCLAEERPWLDGLPSAGQERVLKFYKRWTEFLEQHYDLWKKTYHAGESPGVGAVEIYAHTAQDRGFVFIVNPQYWSRTVQVPLDSSMGFSGSRQCEVREWYPVERLRLTSEGPLVTLGSKFTIEVPAQEVLVLEVTPAPENVEHPRIYGLPGSIEATSTGYRMRTHGPQGSSERFVVVLPPGNRGIVAAEVVANVPKQPKRLWAPTALKQLAASHQGTLMEVTFRRRAAPAELRRWQVRPGELKEGLTSKWSSGFEGAEKSFPLFVDVQQTDLQLPLSDQLADQLALGTLTNFCGAYIDNAFSEMQETWVDLAIGEAKAMAGHVGSGETLPAPMPMDPLARDSNRGWWLQTRFHLPFLCNGGTESGFEEHPILALPLLRHQQLLKLSGWINEVPLDVELYRYPRNNKLGCHYADLVNSGTRGGQDNLLVLHVQF
jgi:hypothetical protein